ncbi:MAG: hypothetical protein EBR27_13735 [Betaproteobacteria bacterium]|nr:hypothetical protein [Betaproteobacteria bacterium]
MTVAVFNKGKFVDFWLNDLDDKSWIERTIASKGWLRQDVEVFWYEYSRNGSEILSFDAEKNLQKISIDQIEIDGVLSPMVTIEQTFNKIPVYLNGAMV